MSARLPVVVPACLLVFLLVLWGGLLPPSARASGVPDELISTTSASYVYSTQQAREGVWAPGQLGLALMLSTTSGWGADEYKKWRRENPPGQGAPGLEDSGRQDGGAGLHHESPRWAAPVRFAADNLAHLRAEAARGGGPHLRALLALLGCPATAAAPAPDYAVLFPPAMEPAPGKGILAARHMVLVLGGGPGGCSAMLAGR